MFESIGTALAWSAIAIGINLWSVPLFGVPLTVVGMSVFGAALGAAYGKPLEKRRDLLVTVASHAFLAAILVAVGPKWTGSVWVTPVLEAPLAGLLAFSARFALPIIPWGELVRKVARLEPKRNDNDKLD
ncbi:hypothetical protein [Stenotrophomonas phage StenR_269]|nr:hypothetical protein [Stenotrophomonas phage StenR_269]